MAVVSTSNWSSNEPALLRYFSPTVQSALLSAPSFVLRLRKPHSWSFSRVFKPLTVSTQAQLTWLCTGNTHTFICQITLKKECHCPNQFWVGSNKKTNQNQAKQNRKKHFWQFIQLALVPPETIFSRLSSTSLTHFTCRRLEVSSSLHFLQNVKFISPDNSR